MPQFDPRTFAGVPPEDAGFPGARFVVLPLPYEATTTYGKGTKFAPAAIIDASRNMERYDEEVGFDPSRAGIHTTDELLFEDSSPEAMVKTVEEAVSHYARGAFVFSLGGEHTLTYPAFLAHRAVHGSVGIVQIDAHADLRESYEGSPLSHACVMRRVLSTGADAVQVGIRSLSGEEAAYLEKGRGGTIFWARDCEADDGWMDRAIDLLPGKVYITLDVDGLDPSLVPCTGTPEPGGLGWYTLLRFLRRLCDSRRVVGADVMELSPDGLHFASVFLVARLVYKIMAYILNAEKR